MTTRNFETDLNALICDLVNLVRVSETAPIARPLPDGERLVALTETNVTTLYRWAPADGFIFAGEV